MRELEEISQEKVAKNLKEIENLPILHTKTIDVEDGIKLVLERIEKLK